MATKADWSMEVMSNTYFCGVLRGNLTCYHGRCYDYRTLDCKSVPNRVTKVSNWPHVVISALRVPLQTSFCLPLAFSCGLPHSAWKKNFSQVDRRNSWIKIIVQHGNYALFLNFLFRVSNRPAPLPCVPLYFLAFSSCISPLLILFSVSLSVLRFLNSKQTKKTLRGRNSNAKALAPLPLNPSTPKSDQFQISLAASPKILRHLAWRTWPIQMKDDNTANSLTTSPLHFSMKGWENVLFELGYKALAVWRLKPVQTSGVIRSTPRSIWRHFRWSASATIAM